MVGRNQLILSRNSHLMSNTTPTTIITTEANSLVADIHIRMPVILDARAQDLWLAPDTEIGVLKSLLKPFPATEVQLWPGDKAVGIARNDFKELTSPVTV